MLFSRDTENQVNEMNKQLDSKTGFNLGDAIRNNPNPVNPTGENTMVDDLPQMEQLSSEVPTGSIFGMGFSNSKSSEFYEDENLGRKINFGG